AGAGGRRPPPRRATGDETPAAVAEETSRRPCDLVILGHASKEGVKLAEEVISAGHHHLLLVPPGASGRAPERWLICVAVGEPGKADVSFAGRLARHLRAEATILTVLPPKIFDFRIMPDFGAGQTVLQDAYIEGRFSPAFRVRAGKFKPPVGLERLQSGADLLFVERALPTNLVPNRDLGVQIAGDFGGGVASYQIGVFNGVVDGGIADADTNSEKDVAARLFFQPFVQGSGPLKNLGFGIAGTSGNQSGTPAAPGLPSYRSPGQATVFAYRSDGTAPNTTIADGRHVRIVPQAYLYSGRFGLLAEYASSRQDVTRGAESRELDHRSWQAAASWVITGGVPTYRSVDPKVVFDPAAHTWGAWEVKVRVSKLDVDPATFPVFANPATAIRSEQAVAVGLNWYLNRNVRLLFDYERTTYDGGFTTGDREDEKIFFSRFQIQF
ncbi:MAG TPA: porin, partial [Thermoanaerobaculia bacterium]|nr:porin [Thermoanaerobaculia bacterium]